jgi:hypothetical protein
MTAGESTDETALRHRARLGLALFGELGRCRVRGPEVFSMSRELVFLEDGQMLVFGWDRAFKTFFAMLHEDHDENKPPLIAIGYHPIEAAILRRERPEAIVGPYPVEERERLRELVREMMALELPHNA